MLSGAGELVWKDRSPGNDKKRDRRAKTEPARFAAGEDTMAALGRVGTMSGTAPGILDRERIIATAGFNRWLVPPAALCIHLCIGMAYGFSVLQLPIARAPGLTRPTRGPGN